MDATAAAEFSHLLAEAVACKKAFLQTTGKVCCDYIKDFQNPHETDERQGETNLCECVKLLLFDPLFNSRHQQDLRNSGDDVFKAKTRTRFAILRN